MPRRLSIVTREELRDVSTLSLSHLIKPHWLRGGGYDSPEWIVVDDLPTSPKPAVRIRWDVQLFDPRRPGETCRLTDSQYGHILDTVKRQSLGLRVGKHATVSTAYSHEEISRHNVNWALWMIGNSIYRFADLGPDDFQLYAERARFGPGFLLGFASRLTEFVEQLRAAGEELPWLKRSRVGPRSINAWKLLHLAGIDHSKGGVDPATSYKLAELSADAGFFLRTSQIQRLSDGQPPPKPLSEIGVLRALQPWSFQWLMRDELPGDCIQFNPFEDVSIRRMAVELGEPTGRTKTAPVHQTMELIDRSIRWVLDYAPVLLGLRDEYLELFEHKLGNSTLLELMTTSISRKDIPKGPGRPFPLNANSRRNITDGLELGIAVNRFIPTACAIVICAFTGRRHDEVLSARAAGKTNHHCITHDENGYWLEIFIEKTSQDWVKTPCNEIVAAAVEILDRWSAPARALSEKSNLFQLRRFTSKPIVQFYLGASLKDFVSFLNLTPLADGSQWDYTPHQFRRFFAIMYYWRYQYRNLGALSYHLRHLDPGMTQIYVTEPESGAIFREVGKQHTVTLWLKRLLGNEIFQGYLASALRILRPRSIVGIAD